MVILNKIYTKTGDKGNTSLIGGTRVSKSDLRIDSYGTIDELNSWIGLIIEFIPNKRKNELILIQNFTFFSWCPVSLQKIMIQ